MVYPRIVLQAICEGDVKLVIRPAILFARICQAGVPALSATQ